MSAEADRTSRRGNGHRTPHAVTRKGADMVNPKNTARRRPAPPASRKAFAPAPEVQAWIAAEILDSSGSLYNADHGHLVDADLAFLWARDPFVRQARTVVGQAEEVMFRAGGWQKQRQEEQFFEWFGRIPAFLITLCAAYAEECSDIEWCALVEHELYHLGHKHGVFGEPLFTRDGKPKIGIRGHDVEEFVGVVARYGAPETGAVRAMAKAVMAQPSVGAAAVSAACGTCMLRAA